MKLRVPVHVGDPCNPARGGYMGDHCTGIPYVAQAGLKLEASLYLNLSTEVMSKSHNAYLSLHVCRCVHTCVCKHACV